MAPSRICRLCLCAFPTLESLLVDNRAQMLQILTSIKVNEDDSSTEACLKCIFNLKMAYRIQQNIIQADVRLREMNSEQNLEQQSGLMIEHRQEGNVFRDDLLKTSHQQQQQQRSFATETPYCLICGEFFGNSDSNEHMKVHFETNNRHCGPCNASFREFEEYKKHLVSQHKKSPSYKCRFCDQIYFYESLYNVHLKNNPDHYENKKISNTNDRPQSLATESYPLNRIQKIRKQRYVPKRIPFFCKVCDEQFPNRYAYLKHTHKRKPCPICDKLYSYSNLHHHIKRHNPVEHICDLCGAKLKNSEGLRTHMYYTHNQLRFKCNLCQRPFQRKNQLKEHVKKEHGNIT